jgi:hypothetical protein
MPVARGNSHPMGIPINVPPVVASPVDPQDIDSGAGEVDADGEDNKKYCFCNNVSYGEMVACDDDGCEREWVCFFSLKIVYSSNSPLQSSFILGVSG